MQTSESLGHWLSSQRLYQLATSSTALGRCYCEQRGRFCRPFWGGRMTPVWAIEPTKGCPSWPSKPIRNSKLLPSQSPFSLISVGQTTQISFRKEESLDTVWTWFAQLFSQQPLQKLLAVPSSLPTALPEGWPLWLLRKDLKSSLRPTR